MISLESPICDLVSEVNGEGGDGKEKVKGERVPLTGPGSNLRLSTKGVDAQFHFIAFYKGR